MGNVGLDGLDERFFVCAVEVARHDSCAPQHASGYYSVDAVDHG
jgi:hypothetical protein